MGVSSRKTAPDSSGPATNHGTSSASGARETWKQAKANAPGMRGKRVASTPQKPTSVDVYDDIDGAHSARSRLKPLVNSAPKAKQLDPLRNQASASSAKSSPLKGNGGLDFFKRFSKPKHEDKTLEAETEENGGMNGAKRKHGKTGQAALEDVAMADAQHSAPTTQSGKGAWKSWAYAEKSKKTFEDEIRELEQAAREKAENDEGGGTSERTTSRRRGRQSNTPVVVPQKAEPPPKTTWEPVLTPNAMETTMAVKTRTAGRPPQASKSRKTEPDAIDVDQVENELEHQLQSEIGSVAPSSTPFKQKLQPSKKKSSHALVNINFQPEHLELMRTIVLQQLTGERPTRLTNLDDEYAKVSNMITQAVTAGESNSMLLIGSRGSGKTALVNQILREQAQKHSDEFHVVRLNGFIHTDDKIALREIWRQLGREMDLDEDESSLKNYADTLTSLLALLSHPAEQGREQREGQVTKSVIFILDEFDLFASHPRQTLLYNLFDIAQSRKAPITVLGLTTRIDVAESLEKRVKSRFSHRYVHLSSAKSFVAFQEACRAGLVIQSDDLAPEEKTILDRPATDNASKPTGSILDNWTAVIDAFLAQEDTTSHLHHIYTTTKSVPRLHTSLLPTISTLSPTTTALAPTLSLSPPDSKLALLHGLSTLHLALLISAARLTAIHAQEAVPFPHAYEEYKAIASKARIQASASGALAQGRIWGKDVARDAWAELVGMGLVLEDGGRGGRVDVGLEEIGMSGVELGSWARWCREI